MTPLVPELAALPIDAVLDGELIALGEWLTRLPDRARASCSTRSARGAALADVTRARRRRGGLTGRTGARARASRREAQLRHLPAARARRLDRGQEPRLLAASASSGRDR